MIEINVPGRDTFRFETLVLDVNGTVALDGELISGVRERIKSLRDSIEIFLITADIHGNAGKLAETLGIQVWIIDPGDESTQKVSFIRECGNEFTVAIGNGANDSMMLKESALGIGIIGPEGTAIEAVQNCDILVPDINAALDMLLIPRRLIATLRK